MISPELALLLDAFERATLTPAEWTHREHLAIAVACLSLEPLEAAIERFRAGLLRLNERLGFPQTDTGGYHESLTQAYIRLIHAHLRALPADLPLADRLAGVLAAFGTKNIILEHYSREVINSPEARYGWVPPDLRAIPGAPFLRPCEPADEPALVRMAAALHDELRDSPSYGPSCKGRSDGARAVGFSSPRCACS